MYNQMFFDDWVVSHKDGPEINLKLLIDEILRNTFVFKI